jgi:tRNA A-37 threonylcarbamoyl transferase component Bud32
MIGNIGPFQILELVGRGAMGAVYRGLDPVIGRAVAVKVIRLIGYNDGEEAAFLRDRLFKEARAAGCLSHPGIVTIYQVGTHDDQAYIAMEYIEGATLEERMAGAESRDAGFVRRYLLQAASALDYAHQRGVVHRDIKPANIMVTAAGDVKVTDFGIAKTLLGHTATKTGLILGTPFYMSPEQVQGKALDGRSDQFALAVIAYQMLTGRRPFEADQMTSVCYQIVYGEPLSAAELNPGLSEGVVRVLDRALAKDPAERFATCTEFVSELVRSVERGEVSRVESPDEGEAAPVAAPVRARRFRWRAAGLGFAAILALAAGFWLVPHGRTAARAVVEAPAPVPGRAARAGETPVVLAAPARRSVRVAKPQRIEARPAEVVAAPAPPGHGELVWTGEAKRGSLIVIASGRASQGSVHGRLPAEPVTSRVFPGDYEKSGLMVFTTDAAFAAPEREATEAGPAMFSWDPRHATDLTVWETPGPANHWAKLVVCVNSAKLTAFVVEWTRQRE